MMTKIMMLLGLVWMCFAGGQTVTAAHTEDSTGHFRIVDDHTPGANRDEIAAVGDQGGYQTGNGQYVGRDGSLYDHFPRLGNFKLVWLILIGIELLVVTWLTGLVLKRKRV